MNSIGKILGAFFAVVLMLTMTACSGSELDEPSQDVADSQSVIDKLESAKSINVKKKVITIGDVWTVSADGEEVAEIRGQAIYLIGDTYAMFSTNGNLVGSEAEEMRLLNHKADTYDYNNESTGAIREEIFSLLYKFYISDSSGEIVGTLNQDFSLNLKGTIKNPDGSDAWTINRDFISIGSDITITRTGDTKVTAMDSVWVAVILSEISDARNSDDG